MNYMKVPFIIYYSYHQSIRLKKYLTRQAIKKSETISQRRKEETSTPGVNRRWYVEGFLRLMGTFYFMFKLLLSSE